VKPSFIIVVRQRPEAVTQSKRKRAVDALPAACLPDKGRFLKDIVPKLQNYYGKAIKENHASGVNAMHDAIWAAYFHMKSTDTSSNHKFCPKGEKSCTPQEGKT
jgi:hypothetical protein